MATRLRVLITGGSGYLGQFLVAALAGGEQQQSLLLAFTYRTQPLLADALPAGAQGWRVDLATGEGLSEAVLQFKPHCVVNCAALSQPAACEQDYAASRALNVPERLVTALQQLEREHGIAALLVHLSTDQVYDGSRAWWGEADATRPVNAYGRSKLEAEELLAAAWPGRHVVLRSSLIFGPEPPLLPVQRPLFLQFVRRVLEQRQPTSFFEDEWRCAVYVQDICAVVAHIISRCSAQQPAQDAGGAAAAAAAEPAAAAPAAAAVAAGQHPGGCWLARLPHSVYNMGGPERLSRHDMALAVARHCQLDAAGVVLTAKSGDVKRGYKSPPDISMTMERLLQDMPGIVLTPFSRALAQIWG